MGRSRRQEWKQGDQGGCYCKGLGGRWWWLAQEEAGGGGVKCSDWSRINRTCWSADWGKWGRGIEIAVGFCLEQMDEWQSIFWDSEDWAYAGLESKTKSSILDTFNVRYLRDNSVENWSGQLDTCVWNTGKWYTPGHRQHSSCVYHCFTGALNIMDEALKIFKFLLYFFHYHLVPLFPTPPSSHHTVVHVHESFFLFAQSLHPLTSPHPD